MFAGKDKYQYKEIMLALHDELAKVNEKWGLMRGDSIAVTGAKHRTTEEYKRNFPVSAPPSKDRLKRTKEYSSSSMMKFDFAEKRVKGLTTMTFEFGTTER